jgi:YVTN family beta-propeller protein
VSPGQTLQEVVVSGDGRELYVGNEDGHIAVLDVASGNVVARLALGAIFGMAIGPDGNTLFVARSLDGTIQAIDRTTRQTIFSAKIGGAPRRVKFDPEGRWILVANESGWLDILR